MEESVQSSGITTCPLPFPALGMVHRNRETKVRSAFCRYFKFLIRIPLFERNSFLLNKYQIPDPREAVAEQETNARKGALEHLYDFLPLHVIYEL